MPAAPFRDARGEPRSLGVAGWWLVEGTAPPRLVFAARDAQLVDAERVAAGWLAERGLGVALLEAEAEPAARADGGWLLASFAAPAGWPAEAPQNQIKGQTMIEGLAAALRTLHSLEPTDELPHLDAAELVEQAARRVRAGMVPTAQFNRARQHLAPDVLVAQLQALVPLLAKRRPVGACVTHGRVGPDTIWLEHGRPTAMIAAGRLAVADPYRDLGALARHLADRFGPEALPPFFDAYGLSQPDPIRLEFHALLDELR